MRAIARTIGSFTHKPLHSTLAKPTTLGTAPKGYFISPQFLALSPAVQEAVRKFHNTAMHAHLRDSRIANLAKVKARKPQRKVNARLAWVRRERGQ